MGFSIKEIKELNDAPEEVLKEVLKVRIVKLRKEGERVKKMIYVAQEMIEQL